VSTTFGAIRPTLKDREVDVPRTLFEKKGATKPILDDDHPGHDRLPYSYENSSTGAPLIPSSLSVSHTQSKTVVQSGSFPNPVGIVDEKVRARSPHRISPRSYPHDLGSTCYCKGHGAVYGNH
jgi:hypothetical protein